MQKWHFRISGQVIIDGYNQPMNIYPENIRDILRISDYVNDNMPQMMAHLSLDKNLFDIIVKNAKTARILLTIEKFDKQTEDTTNVVTEPYLQDEFMIFVSQDINYTKELDYMEADVTGNPPREDVYRQVDIGLISKSCIDANKEINNCIMYESNMQNIVGFFLMHLHPLIEKFDYNKDFDQLIIPPKETLVSTIEMLNSVSVFYENSYQFFIDEPYCTYLLQRNGEAVEKKDDIYPDVYFKVHSTTDPAAVVPGMMRDDQNHRFYIDINALDSKYAMDHDTAKIYDTVYGIINPNVENGMSALDSIQNAMNTINSIIGSLTSQVKSFAQSMESFPNTIYNQQVNIGYRVKRELPNLIGTMLSQAASTMSLINQIPETIAVHHSGGSGDSDSGDSGSGDDGSGDSGSGSGDGGTNEEITIITPEERQGLLDDMNSTRNQMSSNMNSTTALEQDFQETSAKCSTTVYNSQRVQNTIACLPPNVAQIGVNSTKKAIDNTRITMTTLATEDAERIDDSKKYPTAMANNSYSMIDIAKDALAKVEPYSHEPEDSGDESSSSDSNYDPTCALIASRLESIISTMTSTTNGTGWINPGILGHVTEINKTLTQYVSFTPSLNNWNKTVGTMANELNNIVKINIKSKFNSIVTDIRNIGKTATDALQRISTIGKDITSALNFSDINSLKANIASIADLTGIGKLGISKFDTRLSIGGCFGGGPTGAKILRTNNDNPNMIKNICTEIQNNINQLTINKYDLDPSVFTPNKRYTIQNYNGHSNQDGIFLLNKKIELYVREDDTFSCNTALEFSKVADKNVSSTDNQGVNKASDTQQPNANQTTSTKAFDIFTGNSNSTDSLSSYSGYTYRTPGIVGEKNPTSVQDTMSKLNRSIR